MSIQHNIRQGVAALLAVALPVPAWAQVAGEQISGHGTDLSAWGMFQTADIVVQSIMGLLVMASILSWTIWVAKTIHLRVAGKALGEDVDRLRSACTLTAAETGAVPAGHAVSQLLRNARDEWSASEAVIQAQGVKERVHWSIQRTVAAAQRRMLAGVSVIGTIGPVAPFVGLFGTVWGIMNSFIGIANANTTSLTVIAPGIAEALLATGMGLAVAIPAVIFNNFLARGAAGYKAKLDDAATEVLRLVSRDLDRFEHKGA